jgi:hypothetical protein
MRIATRQARGLKFERKTDLSANTLDIRRNCRHNHMLGLMSTSRLILLAAAAYCISGCLRYGDAPVYGAYRAVSPQDLRDAVAAAYKGKPPPHNVYEIHVENKDEVWIYYSAPESITAGSAYIVKRRGGRWQKSNEELHQWTILHHL